MKPMHLKGRWVLVTGASAGLGKAFASRLARHHGAHLVLVARRKDRLETLANELRDAAGVEAVVIPGDLSRTEDVDRVLAEATEGRQLTAAVLNAGVTHFGHYHELAWKDFQTMLQTNVSAVVRMTTELVPHLEKDPGGGGLLIVSSMAGFTPVPYQTAYSATKAFLVSYGMGMWHELEGRNVSNHDVRPRRHPDRYDRRREVRAAPGLARGRRRYREGGDRGDADAPLPRHPRGPEPLRRRALPLPAAPVHHGEAGRRVQGGASRREVNSTPLAPLLASEAEGT